MSQVSNKTLKDRLLNGLFVLFMVAFYVFIVGYLSNAFAMDWNQPILDENNQPVTNCPIDPKTNKMEPCEKIFTFGAMAARALLASDPQHQETPENKALAGNLAIQILTHPETVPEEGKKAEQLKMIRDAIGKLPSPIAVARGWSIIDQAIK